MVQKNNNLNRKEHFAHASSKDLPVSTKQGVEISRFLRYKPLARAKTELEGVIALKRAVPFKRFTKDMGHKAGMSSGRFPQKAAKEFLRLLNSVEANAQFKGLNTSNLKITKILANKASIPFTGGRHRYATKRTHLEVEVKEVKLPAPSGGEKKDRERKEEVKPVSKPKPQPGGEI